MPDRYINKSEIAAIFGTTPAIAEEQLAKAGLRPIDLGRGRKRGKRWLESAVLDAIRRIHEKAQPRPAQQKNQRAPRENLGLATKKVADIEKLVSKPDFTSPHIIQ